MSAISKQNFNFLKALKSNNNRDWFLKNKLKYTTSHENVISFAEDLIEKMSKADNIENTSGKKSIFRIYNDVRFSKDKSPYKTHWGIHLKRATEKLRGGYYVHLKPGEVFVGGGFWMPESADLKLIRGHIAQNDKPLRKLINSKKFKEMFGELQGDKVKTAPKGFSKDDPAIDLLRHKSFTVSKNFSDKEALDPKFVNQVVACFKGMKPFFNYMSEILTHDLNGESLLK